MRKIASIILNILYQFVFLVFSIISFIVEITKNKNKILQLKLSLGILLLIIAGNITSCQNNSNQNIKKGKNNKSIVSSRKVSKKEKLENTETSKLEELKIVSDVIEVMCYDISYPDTIDTLEEKSIESAENDEIYMIADEMPEFPEGEDSLMNFISKNLVYPKKAIENEIQGEVYIRFVINKKGEIENPQIVRSIDSLLDNEALRVVNLLPNFTPGKQNGENVSVWYTIPVKYVLQ